VTQTNIYIVGVLFWAFIFVHSLYLYHESGLEVECLKSDAAERPATIADLIPKIQSIQANFYHTQPYIIFSGSTPVS